jgi:hypothetical protein
MNKLLKMGIGLAALGLTVYVAGVAWKRSQDKKNGTAGFAGAAGGSRLSRIAKAGGFRNADGFADAAGPSSRLARIQKGMGGNIPRYPK